MDSSVSGKDDIWFLRVCRHVPHELYLNLLEPRGPVQACNWDGFIFTIAVLYCFCNRCFFLICYHNTVSGTSIGNPYVSPRNGGRSVFLDFWFFDPYTYMGTLCVYRVSQEECARLREGVPYVKVYRYNPKHLCPKLNCYGDNGQRSLKL